MNHSVIDSINLGSYFNQSARFSEILISELRCKEVLTIVYPKIKVTSGLKSYANKIVNGVSKLNYPFTPVGVRKIEFSISGKPIGGIASQRIALSMHRNLTHPIHALVPEVSPEGVDMVTIHDIIPFLQASDFIKSHYDKSAYHLMYDRALRAKLLIVSTETGKRELVSALNIPDERVRVVFQGIDSSKYHPYGSNPYPDNGKIHLATIGDFNPRKRFDLLYDIVSRDGELELYHMGPVNSWSERASRLKEVAQSSGRIHVMGEVDLETLLRYLTNADLFVFISDAEGFGYPPIEAMACGTNAVLNDLPIFRETVGSYGFLSSIEKFGETIHYALKNKKDKEGLRKRAMELSIEKEIDKLVSIYREFESDGN